MRTRKKTKTQKMTMMNNKNMYVFNKRQLYTMKSERAIYNRWFTTNIINTAKRGAMTEPAGQEEGPPLTMGMVLCWDVELLLLPP